MIQVHLLLFMGSMPGFQLVLVVAVVLVACLQCVFCSAIIAHHVVLSFCQILNGFRYVIHVLFCFCLFTTQPSPTGKAMTKNGYVTTLLCRMKSSTGFRESVS